MNISHMQWLFPLDNDVQLNIFPTTLNVMFKIKHIILPVFQRQYCWTQKQFRLYWKDLNDICLSYQNKKHHIGRFTLFEKENEVVVLDGQQRITTTLIIFICIRDEFMRYNKKHNNSKITKIIQTINSILYNNIKVNGNDDNKENDDNDTSEISEGQRLDFIRFLPTYLDRRPLYNLILDNGKYQEYIANNDKSNNIYNAKRYFDARIANIINGKYDNHKLNKLKNLYNQLLTKFTFVYIGIPFKYWDKGFFIYQWLFEKSVHAGKLLRNTRPGEKHLPCELFKNYILSFFMSFDMDKQENIYIQWAGMEKTFPTQKDFNDYLIKSIGSKETEPYNIYQDLIKIIEKQLKGVEQNDYPLVAQKFLDQLKQNISSKMNTDDCKDNDDDDGDFMNDMDDMMTPQPKDILMEDDETVVSEQENDDKNENECDDITEIE